MSEQLTVLVVCRANVCRSPLAASLMNRYLGASGLSDHVLVRSGGVDVISGAESCLEAAEWSRTPVGHRATKVSGLDLGAADLVLAADRQTRTDCAHLDPNCRPRLFTLNQAAALAVAIAQSRAPESDRTARLRWFVGEMDASRIVLSGRDEESDDIVDRHGPESHVGVFEEVAASGLAIVSAFERFIASGSV